MDGWMDGWMWPFHLHTKLLISFHAVSGQKRWPGGTDGIHQKTGCSKLVLKFHAGLWLVCAQDSGLLSVFASRLIYVLNPTGINHSIIELKGSPMANESWGLWPNCSLPTGESTDTGGSPGENHCNHGFQPEQQGWYPLPKLSTLEHSLIFCGLLDSVITEKLNSLQVNHSSLRVTHYGLRVPQRKRHSMAKKKWPCLGN